MEQSRRHRRRLVLNETALAPVTAPKWLRAPSCLPDPFDSCAMYSLSDETAGANNIEGVGSDAVNCK